MEVSDLTIRLIILIIPGIIATIIVDTLIIHKKWSPFNFTIYTILLGFLSYFLYQVFLYVAALKYLILYRIYYPETVIFWTAIFDKSIPISIKEVIIACLFSIILGFLSAGIIEHRFLSKIAKRLKISYKYGDENLYTHFLNSRDVQWVWVRDKTIGLTYEGYVASFSEDEKIQEIRLIDVKVYSYEDSTLLYEISQIYLAAPPGQFTIEIPKFEKEDIKNGGKNN